MDTRELEYFVAIAEEKNLSHAAARLYIGQPTLTKYIQRLEKEMNIPLFERSGREIRLTYAGERYLAYVRKMLSVKHALDNEMEDIRHSQQGSLRVGMPPVRCSMVLPYVLPLFHEAYPKVEFQIVEDASEKLDQSLIQGDLDIAFFNMSFPKKELAYREIENDRIYAVVRVGHPVGEKALTDDEGNRYIRLEWLRDEVVMLQNRKQRQGEYMYWLLQQKHLMNLQIQVHSNIRAALSLAAGGYGVTFLTGSLIRYFRQFIAFDSYRLWEVKQKISYVAAWKKGAYQPEYIQTFIRMVQENRDAVAQYLLR